MNADAVKAHAYGTLYLVPNTLGADHLLASLPADVVAIAARLDCYVGENAKSTRAFLKLVVPCVPIQQIDIAVLDVNTPANQVGGLLAPLLAGRDVGLVSEAGCPAVADPGAVLVRLAHQHGIRVRPLVGPNSLLLALMASGLDGQSFAFHGYLPTDAAARNTRLRELELQSRRARQTQIFIETPYRNAALLEALADALQPMTLVCVASDLTLPGERIDTRNAARWKGIGASLGKRPSVFLFLAA